MLSDAIKQMRERFKEGVSTADITGLLLTLRAFEMEARNMEDRLTYLTGKPHVALDGRLIGEAGTIIQIGAIAGHAHV